MEIPAAGYLFIKIGVRRGFHPVCLEPLSTGPDILYHENMGSRVEREGRTVSVMMGDYCRDHHPGEHPCPECRELAGYALAQLGKCPFQEGKTTCVRCPVHCYRPEKREKIRTVMRHSGPRMMHRHPWLAITHLIDGRRKKPVEK